MNTLTALASMQIPTFLFCVLNHSSSYLVLSVHLVEMLFSPDAHEEKLLDETNKTKKFHKRINK